MKVGVDTVVVRGAADAAGKELQVEDLQGVGRAVVAMGSWPDTRMRQSLRADTEAVEKLGEAVETWEVSAAAVAELLVTGVAEQRVVVAKAAAVDLGARAADNCSWVEEEGVSDLKTCFEVSSQWWLEP